MKKRIGFFGGSFDPIHFGHLNLAIEMLEKGRMDEILFSPAFCSPFKADTPPNASGLHRLSMIQLILEPFFKVTSVELDRMGPSFTIDTLRSLDHKKNDYRLILSNESANHFQNWKESEEIIKLAAPLVGVRSEDNRTNFQIIEMPLLDVSSSEVRARLRKKLYCKHLLPSIVLDYIDEYGLYLNA